MVGCGKCWKAGVCRCGRGTLLAPWSLAAPSRPDLMGVGGPSADFGAASAWGARPAVSSGIS
eukprot:392682-Lingulodinium_polyedra.AAC.1